MAEEFLCECPGSSRGPKRPLHGAVVGKSGVHWTPQDIEDARALGHLPIRAPFRKWN